MEQITIRLHKETIKEIEDAAYYANIPRAVYLRYKLEQIFDGKPHNPLGVRATPIFYKEICEAFATMKVMGLTLDDASRRLIKMEAEDLMENLAIDDKSS